MDLSTMQGVILPHAQCSQDWLQIHSLLSEEEILTVSLQSDIRPIFYLLAFSEDILMASTALRLATGFYSSQITRVCNHVITALV